MITKVKSLLEQLEERVAVDADTYDVEFIRTLPIVPHDATSNQGFIHAALVDPRNAEVVEGVVAEMKGASWEQVYAVCVSHGGWAVSCMAVRPGRSRELAGEPARRLTPGGPTGGQGRPCDLRACPSPGLDELRVRHP